MSLVEELAPGFSGLEQLRALRRLGRKAGIAESLKFQIAEIEEGLAVFEGAPDARACNPIGTVRGSYTATLLDFACGCAVRSRLAAGGATRRSS